MSPGLLLRALADVQFESAPCDRHTLRCSSRGAPPPAACRNRSTRAEGRRMGSIEAARPAGSAFLVTGRPSWRHCPTGRATCQRPCRPVRRLFAPVETRLPRGSRSAARKRRLRAKRSRESPCRAPADADAAPRSTTCGGRRCVCSTGSSPRRCSSLIRAGPTVMASRSANATNARMASWARRTRNGRTPKRARERRAGRLGAPLRLVQTVGWPPHVNIEVR
jgi:hypothetical protein